MVRIIPIRTTDIVSDNKAGLQRILFGTGLVGGILANDWWPNSEYGRQCFYPAACWLGTMPQSIQLLSRLGMYGFFWYNLVNRYCCTRYRNLGLHLLSIVVVIIVCLGNYIHTTPKFGPRIYREANHIGP